MSNNSISGLSCAEAANLCEKTEYQEASPTERLRLQIHLFFCKACKNYYHRNQKLTELLKKSKLQSCSKEEKEALKERIQAESLEALKNQEH